MELSDGTGQKTFIHFSSASLEALALARGP